jgi:CreA protein
MLLTASLVLGTTFFCDVPLAHAAESSKVVGELKGSGLVFKDTLQIERFDDPKVKGVTLYISNFQRPITEKLSKGFFNDPSYASVACAKTGPVSIADNIAKGTGGEEVFEESKSLLFKTLRVQRIYDVEKKTVVYVSFNTRLDKSEDSNKSRFKSSLCAVSLEEPAPVVAAAAAAPVPAAVTK